MKVKSFTDYFEVMTDMAGTMGKRLKALSRLGRGLRIEKAAMSPCLKGVIR